MKARPKTWLASFLSVLLVSTSVIAQVPSAKKIQFERTHAEEAGLREENVQQRFDKKKRSVTIQRLGNRYRITVRVPDIRWESFSSHPETVYPSVEGFDLSSELGKPVLPTMSLPIALPGGNLPGVQVTIDSTAMLEPPALPAVFYDTPKGYSEVTTPEYEYPQTSFPNQQVFVSRITDEGEPLGVLRIFPVRWDVEQSRYEVTQTIDITLNFPDDSHRPDAPLENNALFKSLVLNPEMVQVAEGQSNQSAMRQSSKAAVPIEYSEAVRITVPKDGVYRITAAELRDSIETNGTIEPNSIRLFHRDEEQPIYVKSASTTRFRGSDYLEFIGKVPRKTRPNQYWDPYNADGVYWLVWGGESGSRFAVTSVEPVDPNPTYLLSFRETLHFEDEQYFDRLGGLHTNQYSDQLDLWLYSSALSAGTLTEFPFSVPSPNPSSLSDIDLTVGLQGLSTGNARKHQAEFFLNNQVVGRSGQFSSLGSATVTAGMDFETRELEDGENSLGISVLEVENEFESLALNWFEVSYDRLFEAKDDFLKFTPPSSVVLGEVYEYSISGFESENIRLYRDDGVMLRDFSLAADDAGLYEITFQTRHHNPELLYYAASDAGVIEPLDLEYFLWEETPDGNTPVDYLIITPEKFRETAESWVTYRESNGWNPKISTTEEIYREHSYGYTSPAAIREVIRRRDADLSANQTLHVLLIGDTQGRLRTADDIIPMRFYQTENYGAAVTDYYYANIDTTNLIPEVAVGRIPVQSTGELETVFGKIQEYEQNAPYGEWRNRSLFIAGYGAVFKNQTEELLRYQTGGSIFPERLYIDLTSQQSRFYGGSADLIQYYNTGVYHVNFMGHGGGAVWADRSLFLREDIGRLHNAGMYPFVTSMTCFTGAIETARGLGELMLRKSDAGAIGWYGSSGLGWIWNDFLLMYDLPEYLQNKEYTLGEIVNLSRINYLARAPRFGYSYLVPTMVHQYNLIGDPATRLAVPEQGESVSLEAGNIQPGDQLRLQSEEDLPTLIQIYDLSNIPLFQDGNRPVTWEVGGSEYEYYVDIPDTFAAGQGHLAWYQFSENGTQHEHGSLSFAIDAPIVENMRTIPAAPKTGQPIRFEAEVLPTQPIDSIRVYSTHSALSLPMHQVSGTTWETQDAFSGFSAGTQVQWWLKVYQSDGDVIDSPREQFQVGFLPDLEVRAADVIHGTVPTLSIVVHSSEIIRGNPQPNIYVRLTSGTGDTLIDKSQGLDFAAANYDTVRLPFYNPGRALNLAVVLDSDETVEEEDESDNNYTTTAESPIFAVIPEFGLTYDGETHAVLQQDSISVTVSGNRVGTPQTVSLEFREFAFDSKKWQMNPKLYTDDNPLGIAIGYPPGNTQPVPVGITNQKVNQDTTVHWYYLTDSERKTWLRINGSNPSIIAEKEGFHSLFDPRDTTPPLVEASVGDQPYLPEMYVGQKPRLRFVVEDSVGVDIRSEAFDVLLDNQPVSKEKMDIKIAGTNQSAIVELQPELTKGPHTISFTAADIHANRTEESEYSILVAGENTLIDYGNFPNPFQSETYFYYEVTNRVSDFTLDIFTVDGRRITRYSPSDVFMDGDITAPGFHKIRWDGRDRNGEFVSNGVYFYQFTVKIGGKTHKSVGKIAKAR